MDWFTSDLHLGHANVIAFSERPFSDVEEMNRVLIDNINARVAPSDTLWILGDVGFKAAREVVEACLARIACRNVRVVRGNHDRPWTPHLEDDLIVETKWDSRRLVLCHYPLMEWVSYYHGSVHLHGHIHTLAGEAQTSAYNLDNRARGILRYDVGVDANHYMPVSACEVMAFFDGIDTSAPTPWSRRGRNGHDHGCCHLDGMGRENPR